MLIIASPLELDSTPRSPASDSGGEEAAHTRRPTDDVDGDGDDGEDVGKGVVRAPVVDAVLRLQAVARGMSARRVLAKQQAAAVVIQRLWRGHAARMILKAVLLEEIAHLLQQIRQRSATKIQALWRGHWARQKVFCYHIYITWRRRCLDRGQSLLQEMMNQRKMMEEEDRSNAELEEEKCSQLVLRKLHHLVSTKSTPGVFNSPRNPCAQAVENGLRKLKFHSLSPNDPARCTGLSDQVRALEWEATHSRKLSVQRALKLPETWKVRLRNLHSIAT